MERPYTKTQKEVYDSYVADVKSVVVDFYNKAITAHESVVKLPHTNETGQTVIAGCNFDMLDIRDHYLQIANGMYNRLSRVKQDEIYDLYLRANRRGKYDPTFKG